METTTLLETLHRSRTTILAACNRLAYVKRSAVAAKRTARKGWRESDAIVVASDGSATVTDNAEHAKDVRKLARQSKRQACGTIARECRRMADAWTLAICSRLGAELHSAQENALSDYEHARFAKLATALQRALCTPGGVRVVQRFVEACQPSATWSLSMTECQTEVKRAQRQALVWQSAKGWTLPPSPAARKLRDISEKGEARAKRHRVSK